MGDNQFSPSNPKPEGGQGLPPREEILHKILRLREAIDVAMKTLNAMVITDDRTQQISELEETVADLKSTEKKLSEIFMKYPAENLQVPEVSDSTSFVNAERAESNLVTDEAVATDDIQDRIGACSVELTNSAPNPAQFLSATLEQPSSSLRRSQSSADSSSSLGRTKNASSSQSRRDGPREFGVNTNTFIPIENYNTRGKLLHSQPSRENISSSGSETRGHSPDRSREAFLEHLQYIHAHIESPTERLLTVLASLRLFFSKEEAAEIAQEFFNIHETFWNIRRRSDLNHLKEYAHPQRASTSPDLIRSQRMNIREQGQTLNNRFPDYMSMGNSSPHPSQGQPSATGGNDVDSSRNVESHGYERDLESARQAQVAQNLLMSHSEQLVNEIQATPAPTQTEGSGFNGIAGDNGPNLENVGYPSDLDEMPELVEANAEPLDSEENRERLMRNLTQTRNIPVDSAPNNVSSGELRNALFMSQVRNFFVENSERPGPMSPELEQSILAANFAERYKDFSQEWESGAKYRAEREATRKAAERMSAALKNSNKYGRTDTLNSSRADKDHDFLRNLNHGTRDRNDGGPLSHDPSANSGSGVNRYELFQDQLSRARGYGNNLSRFFDEPGSRLPTYHSRNPSSGCDKGHEHGAEGPNCSHDRRPGVCTGHRRRMRNIQEDQESMERYLRELSRQCEDVYPQTQAPNPSENSRSYGRQIHDLELTLQQQNARIARLESSLYESNRRTAELERRLLYQEQTSGPRHNQNHISSSNPLRQHRRHTDSFVDLNSRDTAFPGQHGRHGHDVSHFRHCERHPYQNYGAAVEDNLARQSSPLLRSFSQLNFIGERVSSGPSASLSDMRESSVGYSVSSDSHRNIGLNNGILNNQVPPGNRANNYWDNFRSYSRQNMLSSPKFNGSLNTANSGSGELHPRTPDEVNNFNARPANNIHPVHRRRHARHGSEGKCSSTVNSQSTQANNLFMGRQFADPPSVKNRNEEDAEVEEEDEDPTDDEDQTQN